MRRPRSAALKLLETVAGDRCPCGHLSARHRKPDPARPDEKLGGCRDCRCAGVLDFSDD